MVFEVMTKPNISVISLTCFIWETLNKGQIDKQESLLIGTNWTLIAHLTLCFGKLVWKPVVKPVFKKGFALHKFMIVRTVPLALHNKAFAVNLCPAAPSRQKRSLSFLRSHPTAHTVVLVFTLPREVSSV